MVGQFIYWIDCLHKVYRYLEYLFLVYFFFDKSFKISFKRKLTIFILIIAGFVIGTPFSILSPDEFLKGVLSQIRDQSLGGVRGISCGRGWFFICK